MISRHVLRCITLTAAFGPLSLSAQVTGTVRGRITEAAGGAGLAGAQVLIEGTRFGAISSTSGDYVIADVPAGSQTITARRIGFVAARQVITVSEQQPVTVDLALQASATTLSEVVVTGTAAPTERRAVGTSIASVDSSALRYAQTVSLDAALQGKIAGAQIVQNSGNPGGGGITVRLRGTSSFISGSDPLYIIDGVIIDNSSAQLRDLGSRSNVQNRLSDINPADIERIEVIRGAAAAALYGSRANNGVVQIFTKRGRIGKPRITFQSRYSSNELRRRIGVNEYPFDAQGNPVTRFDYQDQIFTRGSVVENNVSVEGGSEQTTYYFGGAWTEEDGIIRNTGSDRKSARLNLSQQVYPKLKVNLGANFVNTHNDFLPNGEASGVITAFLFTPTTFNFFPVNGVYPFSPVSSANPLLEIDRFKNPQDINRFIGSAHARFTPLSNLVMNYTFGYDGYQQEVSEFIPSRAFSSGTLANGLSATVIRDSRILNQDGVATLTTRPLSQIELGSTVGFNWTAQEIRTTTATALDITPIVELVSGATPGSAQSRVELITLGFYGQQTAAWRDRLYLTGALRWDASSTFGPSERWQLYPKLSASYVISEEDWFRNGMFGRAFGSARLRAALGYAGNQPSALNAYSRFDDYPAAPFDGRPGLANSTSLGNPNLKPERQREYEFGGDFAFMDNRIEVEATYYDKLVKDLLFFRPVATSTGYARQFSDIGSVSNKGIELLGRTVNVDLPRFRWESTITYSRNRNRVESLKIPDFQSASGYPNRIAVGQPLGVFFGASAVRNADGSFQLDSLGRLRISPTSTFLGDPNPDWLGSLLNEFTLGKSVRLRALLDGSFGNDVMNLTKRIQDLGLASNSPDAERELLPYGDPRKLPPGFLARRLSIFGEYVEDGTFVKLREVSATYTIDAPFIRQYLSEGIDLTVSGRNLYVWTDYSGYDPEVNLFGQNPGILTGTSADRGFDFAAYPIPRTWSVSARFTY